MILTDYDETYESTFNPYEVENKVDGMPKIGITCFSKVLLDYLIETFHGVEISVTGAANGNVPVYKITYKDNEYALFMSRVGAPACIVQYEELFAQGIEKLIVFGTCGVLDSSIEDLGIIIPNSAIRDEGTSYHYILGSDEIECNKKYTDKFIEVLKEHNFSFTIGKVWTTDAPYRETRNKVLKRKTQGCVCVDMECSAITALA
ncbi:MAG: nucleoside phosphorylase [Bacilli bacterium]|nr:nucleoside phosphorylase [Bacilli bacterium]